MQKTLFAANRCVVWTSFCPICMSCLVCSRWHCEITLKAARCCPTVCIDLSLAAFDNASLLQRLSVTLDLCSLTRQEAARCVEKEEILLTPQDSWSNFHVTSFIAFTSVLCIIEKVVCERLMAMLSDRLDPLQLSSQANTGAENVFTFWISPVRPTLIDLILKVNWLEGSTACRPQASEHSGLHSQGLLQRIDTDWPQPRMDDSNCVFIKSSRCSLRCTVNLSGDWCDFQLLFLF